MQALSERLANFGQYTTQHRDLLEHRCTRVLQPCPWCLAPAVLCAVSEMSQGDAGWVAHLFSEEAALKPFGTLPNQYRNHWSSTCILPHSGIVQKDRVNLSHDLALHKHQQHQHHWLTLTHFCSGPPGFAGCTVVEVSLSRMTALNAGERCEVWRFPRVRRET